MKHKIPALVALFALAAGTLFISAYDIQFNVTERAAMADDSEDDMAGE